jgi:hypothetical protein
MEAPLTGPPGAMRAVAEEPLAEYFGAAPPDASAGPLTDLPEPIDGSPGNCTSGGLSQFAASCGGSDGGLLVSVL